MVVGVCGGGVCGGGVCGGGVCGGGVCGGVHVCAHSGVWGCVVCVWGCATS